MIVDISFDIMEYTLNSIYVIYFLELHIFQWK